MPKAQPIQINIPNPCSQPWEDMTPCGQGRFCNHCQKTVIDFTAWSDAAMCRFFSENTGKVCGRFLATQVGRSMHIPSQPHSRLYRMTIALGLTLVFTQATDAVAQNRPPLMRQSVVQKPISKQDAAGAATGEIRGKVLDERKEPMLSATVQVFQKGVLKGGAVTDFDGVYTIKSLASGKYDVFVSFTGYDSVSILGVAVNGSITSLTNVTLKEAKTNSTVILSNRRMGLVNVSDFTDTNNAIKNIPKSVKFGVVNKPKDGKNTKKYHKK